MPEHAQDSIPRDAIRDVLLRYWDPHNVARNEASHHEYDRLIEPLWQLIQGGDEASIIRFLREREAESMCFPSLGTRRLKLPAGKLLALRPPIA